MMEREAKRRCYDSNAAFHKPDVLALSCLCYGERIEVVKIRTELEEGVGV